MFYKISLFRVAFLIIVIFGALVGSVSVVNANTFESVEINIAELSPAGPAGGYAIPASGHSGICEFEDINGNCYDAPSIVLAVFPPSIPYGSASTVIWSTINAISCTASNGWSGSKSTAGGKYATGNLTSNRTYTLTCTNLYSGVTATKSVTVTVGAPPSPPPVNKADLNPNSLQRSVAAPVVGQPLYFIGGIDNEGTTHANMYKTRFWVKDVDWNYHLISDVWTSGTHGVGVRLLLNSENWTPTTPGTYWVRISRADEGNRISESNESNNETPYIQFTVGPAPKPNMYPATLQLSISPVAGTSLNFTSRIENSGDTGSGNFDTRFQVATAQSDAAVIFNSTMGAPDIPSGGNTTITSEAWTPPAAGTYYVRVNKVDNGDDVTESNEGDNVFDWIAFTANPPVVPPQPDLRPNSPYATGPAIVGSSVSFSSRIDNIGPGDSPSSQTQFEISQDQSTILFSSDIATNAVVAGGNTTITSEAWTPPSAGTYYVRVNKADNSNVISESNEANNVTSWVSFVASDAAQTPTVSLEASLDGTNWSTNDRIINIGDDVQFHWSSTDATSCVVLSGSGFSTGGLVNGIDYSVIEPLADTSATFSVQCTGPGGTATDQIIITTSSVPIPTVSLTADPVSVASNGASTLTWTVANATSCTASDGWSGGKTVTGGSESTGALVVGTTYTLSCTGPGGTTSDTVTVAVGAAPPTVDLTADDYVVDSGDDTTLNWTVTNATSCTASEGWSGSKAVTGGSEETGELTSGTAFTLSCTGPGGTTSDTVIVSIATGLPDLNPNGLQRSVANPVVGQPLTFIGWVDNEGNVNTPTTYRTRFQVINAAGTSVFIRDVWTTGIHGWAQRYRFETPNWIPIAPGTYHVRIFSADEGNRITESNETNNTTGYIPFTVGAAPIANLTPTSLELLTASAFAGTPLNFTSRIENSGDTGSGNFDTQFEVSQDQSTILFSSIVAATDIPAGGGYTTITSGAWTPPSAGTYYVRVNEVDYVSGVPDGVVTESNEGDNVFDWIAFTVEAGSVPNLQPVNLGIVETSRFAGSPLTFTTRVDNAGTADSGNFDTRFQVSQDQSTILFNSTIPTTDIPAAGNRTLTSGAWTPPSAGTYYVRVNEVDYVSGVPDGVVTESNEGDNTIDWQQIDIYQAPTANLQVSVEGGGWTANDVTISELHNISLRWSSTNATTCSGSSSDGNGNFSTGGATGDPSWDTDPAITEPEAGSSRIYTVQCTGPGGSASDQITVATNLDVIFEPKDRSPTRSTSTVTVPPGKPFELPWDVPIDLVPLCKISGGDVTVDPLTGVTGSIIESVLTETVFVLECSPPSKPVIRRIIIVRVLPRIFET